MTYRLAAQFQGEFLARLNSLDHALNSIVLKSEEESLRRNGKAVPTRSLEAEARVWDLEGIHGG